MLDEIASRDTSRMTDNEKTSAAQERLAWEFIAKVLDTLGNDGMSSDESGCESSQDGSRRRVFKKKTLPWRRNIDNIIRALNVARAGIEDVVGGHGATPAERSRHPATAASTRAPPIKLPRAFYDDLWYEALHVSARAELDALPADSFVWQVVGGV